MGLEFLVGNIVKIWETHVLHAFLNHHRFSYFSHKKKIIKLICNSHFYKKFKSQINFFLYCTTLKMYYFDIFFSILVHLVIFPSPHGRWAWGGMPWWKLRDVVDPVSLSVPTGYGPQCPTLFAAVQSTDRHAETQGSQSWHFVENGKLYAVLWNKVINYAVVSYEFWFIKLLHDPCNTSYFNINSWIIFTFLSQEYENMRSFLYLVFNY